MQTIDITLTWHELLISANVGTMRRISSMQRGMDKNKNAAISNWATDIDGAASECALAKHLNCHWGGHVGNLYGDDLPGGLQVRSTEHGHGHLLLRPTDKERYPNAVYVLAVSKPPIYSLRGWIRGGDGMVPQYWREEDARGGAAWWVPQNRLSSISTLPRQPARQRRPTSVSGDEPVPA